ncbi:hypothetical protein D3C81_2128040 [compost metagenome]
MRFGIFIDGLNEFRSAARIAPDADDLRGGGQIAGAVTCIQCRNQFAHRQVAAAAKQDKVKISKSHGEEC